MILAKGFYYFLTAKTLFTLADVIYIMIVTTYIYQATGSAVYAALFPLTKTTAGLLASFSVPLLFRKFSYHVLYTILPLLKSVLVIIFTINFSYINEQFVLLFLFVLLIAFFEGWIQPILSSTTPKMVAEEKLIKANGLLSFSGQTIQIVGYTFTGLFVLRYGATLMLVLTCILLCIAFVFLFLSLKVLTKETALPTKGSKFDSLKAGWSLIWKNRSVRIVTIMDVIEGIAGSVWIGAITLVYVNEVLNKNEAWWGYINASYYIGTILGGVLALMIAEKVKKHLLPSMALGSFLFGIFTLSYGFNSFPWLALVLCVLMGPAYQIRDITQQTILQLSVKGNDLTKVYAAHGTLKSAVMGISVFIIGVISDLFGARMVYIFAGIICLCSSCLSFVLLKKRGVVRRFMLKIFNVY